MNSLYTWVRGSFSTAAYGRHQAGNLAWLLRLRPNFRLILSCAVWMPLFTGSGCGDRDAGPGREAPVKPPATSSATLKQVREPAVAGLFYPAEGPVLSQTIDGLLEKAEAHYLPRLRGLVCPHAGYVYSGPTAACAYKTVAGRDARMVVILAPSHYAGFAGASVPATDAYRTPLGLAALAEPAQALASKPPFVREPRCPVERPAWWLQASKPAPAPGQDTPDTWEHSAEVQVPFLQKVLKDFKILPVVFGEVDPEQAARVLAGVIDARTLVVASSDLSHYHPYDEAKRLDARCVKAICDLDIETMKTQEACGKGPVLALMHLARLKGWKTQLLDCRNSGDATSQKERVVGYAAIAFYEPAPAKYAWSERKLLLDLARQALTNAATMGGPPALKPEKLPPMLHEARGCFVTLTKAGVLRGCIGNIIAQGPLWQAVIDNARNAAVRDPRFTPVQPAELGDLKLEVSVLTPPQPLPFDSPEDLLARLEPYEDGVLLNIGARGATFLPQVWAQIPDKTEFMNHLSSKAGCAPGAWRGKETTVSIYHVEAFDESELEAGRD